MRHTIPVAVVAAAVMLLIACSGDEEADAALECGEDTRLYDGECVIVDHDCPADQVVSPIGECVDPEVFCGDGSVYDEGRKRCISTADVRCGEGTVEVGDECVVADPLYCGDGTVLADETCELMSEVCGPGTDLDESACRAAADACEAPTQWDVESGECVIVDEIQCGEETVEVDDACIPVSSFADELAANADFDHADGNAIDVAGGEPVVFTGTMDESLRHRFDIEAQEGQWLAINLYSRGLPSPAFTLSPVIGVWERSTPPGVVNQPSRTVLIPSSGDYELVVETSLSDEAPEPVGEGEFQIPFGDESWQYVGTVELLEAPTPSPWDVFADSLQGTLDESTANFTSIDVDDIDDIVVTISELGADAVDATIELWESPDQYDSRRQLSAGESVSIDTEEWSTVYLHIDAARLDGPRIDFEFDAHIPTTLEPNDAHHDHFDATAGELIILAHRSDDTDDITARVYRDGLLVYERHELRAENDILFDWGEANHDYYYVPADDSYLVEFENTSSSTITGFISSAYVEDAPRFVPDPLTASSFQGSYDHVHLMEIYGDWRYAIVDTATAAMLDVDISSEGGTPDARLLDFEGNILEESYGGDGWNEFQAPLATPGVYFIGVFAWESVTGELGFELNAKPIETVASGAVYEERVQADGFGIIHGNISYLQGSDIDVRLLNPQGNTVFEASEIGDSFSLMEILPGPGEYILQVENGGETPILELDVDVDAYPPVDIVDVDAAFSHDYDEGALDEGQRSFWLYHPRQAQSLSVSAVAGVGEQVRLRLWELATGEPVAEAMDTLATSLEFISEADGLYALEVMGVDAIENGYSLSVSGSEIEILSGESAPSRTIDHVATDAIDMESCPSILDIEIDVDITHHTRSDLVVTVVEPGGQEAVIHDQSGGTGPHIVGSYPYPEDSDLEDGEQLLDFVGDGGTGVWFIEVVDAEESPDTMLGILNEWSITLICEV